jgi:hypothetical protein
MGKPNMVRAVVATADNVNKNQAQMQILLVDTTGAILNVPKKAAARADMGTLTSTDAAGATPTDAEFDALRADVVALRTLVNDLLAKLRTANIIASS